MNEKDIHPFSRSTSTDAVFFIWPNRKVAHENVNARKEFVLGIITTCTQFKLSISIKV